MAMLSCSNEKAREEMKPEKAGGHGDHWFTVVESDNEIESAFFKGIENPESVESLEQKRDKIKAYFSKGEMLKSCTVTVNNEIWTAYPFVADGIAHEITINGIEEWTNEREAQIRCTLEGASLAFFDTMYFKNKGIYEQGKKYTFHLSALAYYLTKLETGDLLDRNITITPEKGAAGFFWFNKGDIDDFIFLAPVKEVTELKFENRIVYRVKAPLFRKGPLYRLNGEDDIDLFIFVLASRTGGYIPAVGDDITGIMWLQGYIK